MTRARKPNDGLPRLPRLPKLQDPPKLPMGLPAMSSLSGISGGAAASSPIEDGDSEVVAALANAITTKTCLSGLYKGGGRRWFCPSRMGRSHDGDRRIEVFQTAGASESGLPEGGRPSCWRVAQLSDLRDEEGPWRPVGDDPVKSHCLATVEVPE